MKETKAALSTALYKPT